MRRDGKSVIFCCNSVRLVSGVGIEEHDRHREERVKSVTETATETALRLFSPTPGGDPIK